MCRRSTPARPRPPPACSVLAGAGLVLATFRRLRRHLGRAGPAHLRPACWSTGTRRASPTGGRSSSPTCATMAAASTSWRRCSSRWLPLRRLRDPPSAGRPGRPRSASPSPGAWRAGSAAPRAGLLAGAAARRPCPAGGATCSSTPRTCRSRSACWPRSWPGSGASTNGRARRCGTLLLLGLAVGLTVGIRIGGVLLAVYFAAALAAARLRRPARRSGRAALSDGLAGGVSACSPPCRWRCWCWSRHGRGWRWRRATSSRPSAYLSRFPYTADTIFAGQRFPAPAVPLGYWPTLLALQLPEIVLAGLAPAPPLPLGRPGRGRRRRRVPLLLVASPALFPMLYAMLARPTAYNALRHFIFVLPPLAVLAALGLDRALTCWAARCDRSLPGGHRRGVAAAGAADRPAAPLRVRLLQRPVRRRSRRGEPLRARLLGHVVRRARRPAGPKLLASERQLGPEPIAARICGPLEAAQRGPAAEPAAGPRQHARARSRSRSRSSSAPSRRPAASSRGSSGRASC